MREPRIWSVTVPPEPEGVNRVRDSVGAVWTRDAEGRWWDGEYGFRWVVLLSEIGTMTEVVE